MKVIVIPNSPVMAARHYCLASTLADQGHEVHYFMWELPFRIKPKQLLHHLFTSLIPNEHKYERFTMHKVCRLPYFWPVVNGWLFKAQLTRLFNRLGADIILTEGYTNETEVPKKLPYIYDLADDYAAPADVYGGPIYKLAFKLLGVRKVMERQCKHALAVTAVSENLCEFARQHNPKVVKLPNGVDKDLMESILKDKTSRPTNPHSLVYMTRFGEWSRAIETLEAVVELKKEFPKLEITLIGEGSETDSILSFIMANYAQSYIHYLGFIYDRRLLLRAMSRSAIGLNISDKNKWRDASHPIKVIEYSAFGKKVVSTDLDEVKALRFPNVWLLSSEQGSSDLKSTLRSALRGNADLSHYEDISKQVLNDYDWHRLVSRLVGLMEEVKDDATGGKVVHVTPSYPPKLGGLENVVEVLARTQSRMGQQASVLTSNQGAAGMKFADTVAVNRLRSFVIANTTIMPALFAKLLRVSPKDVVHVHVTQAFAPEIVWLAAKFRRFKYVCHVHLDVPPSGPAGFLLKAYKPLVLKRVLQTASFVVVFTQDQKREAVQQYELDPARVLVVPNGVEDKFYLHSIRTLRAKPRLLFVGRLNYQKNLGQLLHALDGISDSFETTLVGEGELEGELRQLTSNLNLQNVTFAGRKNGEELLAHYKSADVFVLPSEREGMPLVLLEAMAMGLPIVATNVTGSKDVVRHGVNGRLVPYSDVTALRSALLEITSDSATYAKASQASSKEAYRYTWDKVAAQFIQLYGAAK